MTTKLNQLLDELTMLKEYFAQDLLVNGLTEMVVLKDDLEELIARYTETTPTYKPGDKVRVIKCLYEHCFDEGEIITLLKYRETRNDWKCSVEGMIQHLTEEEFEPIN